MKYNHSTLYCERDRWFSMNRRSVLRGLGLPPLLLTAEKFGFSERTLPKLTVTYLEVFRVKVNHRGNWTIARLQISGGITGLGDASQSSKDDQTLI